MIKTEIGYTTPTKITVRGKDLALDLMGKMDFVEALVLCMFDRLPTAPEKRVLNAILLIGLDHGLTPSAITARMTYLGAPESLQGAVAAGLLGAGTRFLGTTEMAIRQFLEFSGQAGDEAATAQRLIDARRERGETLFGYGHPIHKDRDPRVDALRDIARDNGFYGSNWRLADQVAAALKRRPKPLNMNASGAMAATIADMGMDPVLGGALMLVARCGGLVAHILEERKNAIGQDIWDLVLTQDPRNEIPHRQAR